MNIRVHRYPVPSPEERAGWPEGTAAVSDHWQGWIEPDDGSWIVFVERDGSPMVFLRRDDDGGVIDTPVLTG